MIDGNKYWFNGLPVESPLSDLSQRVWFNGLPVSYAPSAQTLVPPLLTNVSVIFNPAMSLGAAVLSPVLLTNVSVIFNPTMSPGAAVLSPALLTNASVIYAPTMTARNVLEAPLFTNASVIFNPEIQSTSLTLEVPLLTNASVIYNPIFAPGSVTLVPPLLDENDQFFGPEIIQDQTVTAPLLASTNGFFSHNFVPSAVVLSPPLLDDADTIHAPTISSVNALVPPLLQSSSQIFAPTMAAGSVALTPPLLNEADVLPSASIVATHALVPPLLASATVIFNPSVTSRITIEPPLHNDADALYSPSMLGGGTIFPPLLTDGDILFPPVVQRVKGQGNGGSGGGQGGNVPENLKYASTLVMGENGLITAAQTESSTAKVINTRMVVYADASGVPGAKLAESSVKTSVVVGLNTYPLLVPLAATAGTILWIALHSDGNFNWFLKNAPGGARYNTDLFSDGASDPFGAASVDNKKSPLFVVFLEAVTTVLQMPLLTSDSAIYPPSLLPGSRTLSAPLTGESFLYPPSITSKNVLEMPIVGDIEGETLLPSIGRGALTIEAPLLDNNATPLPPIMLPNGTFLVPETIGGGNVIFAPSIANADSVVEPPLLSNEDTPLVPEFTYRNVFSVDQLQSGNVLFPPSIATGSLSLEMPLFENHDQIILDAFMGLQPGVMGPPLLTSGGVLYPPTLARPHTAQRVSIHGFGATPARVAASADPDASLTGDGASRATITGAKTGVHITGSAAGRDVTLETEDA